MNQKQLGRYELIRVLGKGAMGLVYEGRDPNLDRRVAIKTIKVENLSSEEAAEYEIRFRTEARSAARLQHPNIVSVYDSDRDGDIAYLVMEFIQGQDLKHHLDQGVRYTLRQAAGIMNDLLSALDYAHRQNIVHRDIKPANLLIEADGRVKLTDFGVARIQDSGEATRTQGTMVGTLKYMSPEQLQGLPIDARSDLFSAAIVLYQLLTSTRPFDGNSDYEIIQKIIGQAPAVPSSIHPHLPPAIDAVVARALKKSRDARYASAQEFNAALQAAADTASDATITPPKSAPRTADSATWTSTMIKGESLVNTNTGSMSGLSGSAVAQEVELVYWKEIKDSEDIEQFQDYLQKFPTGIYADLARRRLKRLQHPDGTPGGSRSGTGTGTGTGTRTDSRLTLPPAGLDEATRKLTPVATDPEATRAPPPRDTTAPAAPAAASVPARRPAWLLAGAGAAVLVVGLLGYLGLRSPAPAVQAAAVTSQSATQPVAGSADTPPSPGAASKTADSKPAAKPAPAPASTAGKPAGKAPLDPEKACEGRVFLAYLNCMKRECDKPSYAQHPVCVRRKAMEDSNQINR